MKTFPLGLLSFAAAALVPAALFVAVTVAGSFAMTDGASDPYALLRARTLALTTVIVSAAHVLALGVPAFFLLRHLKVVTWWSSAAAGFLLGCLPAGVITWPLRYADMGSSASHWDGEKMVDTMVNGVPTAAGWLTWLTGMGFVGLLGAIGGFSFWLVWRRGVRPNNSFKPNPLRGSA